MHLASWLLYSSSLATSTAAYTLKDTLAAEPSLSVLHRLLKQFGLLDTFDSAKNITLLAPTDQAYEDLAKWGFNVSEVPPEVAKALLTYHVMDASHASESIAGDDDVTVAHMLLRPLALTNVTQGAAVKLFTVGGQIVTESGLQVLGGGVQPDIEFDQGFIYTVNSSLVLPHNISITAQLQGLTKFLDVMESSNMVPELEGQKDVTVFIPHNAALKGLASVFTVLTPDLMAEILSYHAISNRVLYNGFLKGTDSTYKTFLGQDVRIHSDSSGTVYVNGARVVRKDLIIYGGVAHIIDAVLTPSKGSAHEKPSVSGIGALPAQRIGSLDTLAALQSGVAQLGLSAFVVCSVIIVLFVRQRRSSVARGVVQPEMKRPLPA